MVLYYLSGMKRYLTNYPLTILVIAVITFLSLFNPPETKLDTITNIDKLVHLCMYGGLEVILWLEYLKHHRSLSTLKIWLLAILAPVFFGGMIELAQMYLTETRSGDWIDFASDALGVFLGAVFGYFVIRPLVWKH